MLPLACIVPATLIPVVVVTTTFGVPPTDAVILPPDVEIVTLLVPLLIAAVLSPVTLAPLILVNV